MIRLIGVTGSRSIINPVVVNYQLNEYLGNRSYTPDNCVLVFGDAMGVDLLTKDYCKKFGFRYIELYPINHLMNISYSRDNYLARDIQMVLAVDEVLAIWDGESTGTAFTMSQANKFKKPLTMVALK